MKKIEPINDGSAPIWGRCVVLFGALGGLGLTIIYADIGVGFSSVFDAVNQHSDGSSMDTSFTFELGSFNSSFTPTAANTHLWSDNWDAAPGSGGSSSVGYTQAPINPLIATNTGASNNFSGSVTLDPNGAGANGNPTFSTGDQAYIWGYDDRGTSGTGEWILITNPSWSYPAVTPGIQIPGTQFDVGDAGTIATLGSVNPEFSTVGDDPHMQSGSVGLLPVPEPSVAMLLLGGVGMMLVRRRH
ncbi:MAG: hypothetical protein ACI8XO_002204 [Verrucomicrobiales bacterium]